MKSPTRATPTLPWQYRLGRYAAVIFMLASVAVGGWLVREPVLVAAADLWIVSDSITRAEWAERNAASVFIIPSEIFSARRVRWIFRREFFGTAVSIEVPSFEPPGYTRWNWWKTEQGLVAFRTEFLKYTYYRLKY